MATEPNLRNPLNGKIYCQLIVRQNMNLEYILRALQPTHSSLFSQNAQPVRAGRDNMKVRTGRPEKENIHLEVSHVLSRVQRETELGYALLLARHNKDNAQKTRAIHFLMQHINMRASKKILQVSGTQYARCMKSLITVVVENICRTADSAAARCRCGGRGYTFSRQGDQKTCLTCKGSGVKKIPSSAAHRIIRTLLPEVSQSSWSRHWKPFYEGMINHAEKELSRAEWIIHQYREQI